MNDPLEKQLVDLYQGIEDLKFQKIRTVGAARQRFDEDSLRPFRAVRFVSQLEFELDAPTFSAIVDVSRSMLLPAMERIGSEWQKLIKGPGFIKALELLQRSGLWTRIFPSWTLAEAEPWLAANKEGLARRPAQLRLAAVFVGRSDAEEILRRLSYSKQEINWTVKLIDSQLDEAKASFEVNDLKLKPTDLIALGLYGEAIGRMQRALLEFVRENLARNKKAVLLEECKRLMHAFSET